MANYFSKFELDCPCCGDSKFSMDTLAKINELREAVGFPLIVNSAYRCEKYNTEKGYTQTHYTGQAVDLRLTHNQAYAVLSKAPAYGFTGIGVSQKGNLMSRFIHLDDLPEIPGRPRPHVWSY